MERPVAYTPNNNPKFQKIFTKYDSDRKKKGCNRVFINVIAGADNKTLPESHIQALLLNVPFHGLTKSKIRKAKEMINCAKPAHVMLDSGGFQLLQAEEKSKNITFNSGCPIKHTNRELNITPKHVMETASAFQADIVVGLDWPIIKINKKYSEDQKKEFFKKLKYNVDWAFDSAYWHKRLCLPRTKYFLPIQCYNVDHLNIFLNSIAGLDYDGVSLPIRNMNIQELVLFLVSFLQQGIKRVHLLGTSSFPVIILGAYMARHKFDWISIDATSWRMAAQYAEFFDPFNLSRKKLGSKGTINYNIKNECSCPFCSGKSFKQIQNLTSKEKYHLLRNHNWWVLERSFHDLYQNSTDVIQLERFLKSRSKNPAMVDELCEILSRVDLLNDVEMSLLQDPLDTSKKKRRPSSSRLTTVAV